MENIIRPSNPLNPLEKPKFPNEQDRLANEEKEQFEAIGIKVLELLAKEGIVIKDFSLVVKYTTQLINEKFDNAPIEKLLEL